VTRILFVSSYTGIGGGETVLLSLMQALMARGVEPILLVPRDGQLPRAARDRSIAVRTTAYRGAPTAFVPWIWARLPATRRIRAEVEALKPDLVFSDYHSLPYVSAALRRASSSRPLIFLCWGWWFRPRPWQRAFFRNGPTLIAAASRAVRDGFVGSPPFITPPDRIPVLYAGVDVNRFVPARTQVRTIRAELSLPDAVPLVTMVARFQDVKGHDVFLAAARIVAARLPGVRFVVAGESIFGVNAENAFKRRVLLEHARDPLLRERVQFMGWVPDPERLLAASDLIVCPSHFETFGMAIVEAMSCGLPVVSTNVGGPGEIVIDGVTGFLVPPKQPAALAERIVQLLDDPALRERMSAAARERVLANFTLDRFANEFMELAAKAVATHQHRQAGA
jgi:glycosyltransferase involved in cell wall biosynthesis